MLSRWLLPTPLSRSNAILLAMAFLATHALSLLLIRYGGPLAPAWPPVGIALAALIWLPTSHRRLIFVGVVVLDTLSNALQGYASLTTVAYLGVTMSELLFADWLLRRFASSPLRFARLRDVSLLLLVTALATAVGSVPAAFIAHAASGDPLIENAIVWWVGDMLAYVIVTPLTVLLLERRESPAAHRRARWWWRDAFALTLLFLVGSLMAFRGDTVFGALSAHPYMLSLVVLWATLRFGQIGALCCLMGIATVGVTLLLAGQSLSLGGKNGTDALVILQVYLGVQALIGLVLATALREQRETAEANAHMLEALSSSEQRSRQSQKMEAIGQLAGGVAHDFNNVLAAVLMQLDELRLLKAMPREALELLRDVETSAQRAVRLTRQLLVFSRQQAMQSSLLDLNMLVRTHVRLLRRVVPTTHALTVETAADALVVSVDGGMIEQVLLNLVLNARDALAEGGLIMIRTDRRVVDEVEAGELTAGHYAVLVVQDTGAGISPENMPRIFEPFFTTKPPGQGTGLGLATAYGIAQQHQGRLLVSSTVGVGTTVEVWLPVVADVLPDDGASAYAASTDSDEFAVAATVLVVEDEPTVSRLLQRVLERDGFTVRAATSGREVLDHWNLYERSVDLVITDLVMPGGVSGTQLAAELRRLKPSLPIVFTSGYDPEFDPSDETMVPGENFIPKPSTAEQILAVVRRQIASRVSIGES
ncbi:MASE1 domain-containing protein [Gemmatimonas sp.]|uniref:hybrid sensor histidine kinase/response regulator n=1 Tax=Gemmatimonas sp. TaxID=1962908 RepID=UPI003983AC06